MVAILTMALLLGGEVRGLTVAILTVSKLWWLYLLWLSCSAVRSAALPSFAEPAMQREPGVVGRVRVGVEGDHRNRLRPLRGGLRPLRGGLRPLRGGLRPLRGGLRPLRGGLRNRVRVAARTVEPRLPLVELPRRFLTEEAHLVRVGVRGRVRVRVRVQGSSRRLLSKAARLLVRECPAPRAAASST